MTAELADNDWLLRNVEGCLTGDRHATEITSTPLVT